MRHRFCKMLLLLVAALLVVQTDSRAADSAGAHRITTMQWQQLTSDKAFGYKNEVEQIKPPPPPPKYLGVLERMLMFFTRGVGKVIIWIIVLSLLCLLLYFVVGKNLGGIFRRSKKIMSGLKNTEDDENIYTTNWEALMNKAKEENNLQLSVRYGYMWLLQLLQQRQLINYKQDKTNFEYYQELAKTTYKLQFQQLSRKYEYAYYGNYPLSARDYSDFISVFESMRRDLR